MIHLRCDLQTNQTRILVVAAVERRTEPESQGVFLRLQKRTEASPTKRSVGLSRKNLDDSDMDFSGGAVEGVELAA
jgi:hypothetical protein